MQVTDTHGEPKDHEVLQAMPRHEFSNRLLEAETHE